ncbi:flagellar assembly peptidoglycan hydrolase FlgJ [Dongshaea marina]|uniref:flagellar assembly peptidoglycan hydrolase FlgJ n=1 Tax=Dongshaea marina TaxID=2047966 RepID=UPI000D3EB13B|nr:flagellar assembly peptidoglycan hydrolase FlgJ [Dongshaea marina]
MNGMDPTLFTDIKSLDRLRQESLTAADSRKPLLKAAQQFESFFTQMLLTRMREANRVFEADSPFNSHYTRFYQGMLDQQMAVEMSQKGSLGLAQLMVEQLSPTQGAILPGQASGYGAMGSQHSTAKAAPLAEKSAETGDKPVVSKAQPIEKTVEPTAFDSPKSFIDTLLPLAKGAAEKLGTSPLVLLAQAALETGWGKKLLRRLNGESSFNLFNIKADPSWQGESTRVTTLEYKEGVAVKQSANFRSYDDFSQSFGDYVEFLQRNPRYREALQSAADPERFIEKLQQAGYATDPKYASKVMRVFESIPQLSGDRAL